MNRLILKFYLFFTILLVSVGTVWGQKPLNPVAPVDSANLVEVLYAEIHEGVNLRDMQTQTFTGNVRFRHQGVLIGTNRAIQNTTANTVEAFGKIVINQGDTLTIVGDTLFYDGNSRIATIWGRSVVLRDRKVTLTTKKVIYNIPENMAYYPVKGEIIQDSSLLSSNTGYYNTQTKYFNYIGDVEITNPDFVLCTDTMDYDTHTKHAIFKAPTVISGKKGDMIADEGWYNIESKEAYFVGASKIENEDYFLSGDTLFYDNTTDYGEGFGNVFYISKKDSLITAGNSVFRDGEKGITRVMGETVTKIFNSSDTSYLVADSLFIQEIRDSISFEADTLTQEDTGPEVKILDLETHESDSTRTQSGPGREDVSHVIAFGEVKTYRADFQSNSDSLVYNRVDSTIRYYGSPIIWYNKNQLQGDSINIYLENDKIRQLEMKGSCLVIQEDTIGNYNQLKGREINAFFNEDTDIESIHIFGNAESKFFVLDDDQRVVGLNLQQSSRMTFLFAEGELEYIKAYTDVDEETVPPGLLTRALARFPEFNYRIHEALNLDKIKALKHGEKVVNAKLGNDIIEKTELPEALEME